MTDVWHFTYDQPRGGKDRKLVGLLNGRDVGYFEFIGQAKRACRFVFRDGTEPVIGRTFMEVKDALRKGVQQETTPVVASNGDIEKLAALVVKLTAELQWAKDELRKALG